MRFFQRKIAEMEKLEGIDRLSPEQLLQFEHYLYSALDFVKVISTQNTRFAKQYKSDESVNTRKSLFKSDFHLSEVLGVFDNLEGSDDSDSSESSLDFESSFYRFKGEEKGKQRQSEASSEMEEIGELLGSIAKPTLKPTVLSPKFNRFSFGLQVHEELKEEEDKPSL